MSTILPNTANLTNGTSPHAMARYTLRVWLTKNQISRAQCRVKSGTARAENGARWEEVTCEGKAVGSVHAMTTAAKAEKSFCVVAEIGATGSGCELGADDDRQQDLPQEQQP